MTENVANPSNTQVLPQGMANPAAPVVPAAPPHNPMLSHLSNPPPVVDAVKEPVQAPAVVAPPVITLPTVESAPATKVGDLAQGFLADPQVKLASSYIDAIAAEGKLDVQRALGKSFSESDARFIDEAYIRDTLKDKAENFLATARSMVEYVNHHRTAVINSVYESAGGEQQWSQAVEAFQRVANPDERATLIALLDSAEASQVKYAAARIIAIASGSGAVLQHNSPILGKGSASQGLSASEYQAALIKEGNNISPTRQQELRNLRFLGKQQNL